jgi:hypothetical protein
MGALCWGEPERLVPVATEYLLPAIVEGCRLPIIACGFPVVVFVPSFGVLVVAPVCVAFDACYESICLFHVGLA